MATNNTNSTKVVTKLVRFSYVHIFKPEAIDEDSEKKYSMAILIPKSDKATLQAIRAAVEAAKEKGKSEKWNGKIPANLKTPLRDGDVDRPDDDAYAGHYFLNCSSKQKPQIVDSHCQAIIDENEVYSGCYGRVSINFFPFDAKGNKGVAAGLNNVQKIKDGESLAGGSTAEEDFNDGFGEDFDDDDDFLG